MARDVADDVGADEIIECPLCEWSRFDEFCTVTTYAQPFRMVRCSSCSLLYRNPRPAADALAALYDEDYYAGDADFSYGDERANEGPVRVRAAGRLARVEALLARDGVRTRRVVELGCAFGVFLDEARKRGWEVQGCEVSPTSGGWAHEQFGIDVHACDLADAGLAAESVDLVTGSELIEHLTDPLRTVRAAYDALAPDGVAVFSTANEKSVARLLRGARWGYFMPGHVVVWSAQTITCLLEEAGFADVRVTAGDERGLANYRRFLAAGGPGSVPGWLVRRLRWGWWTLGAGMVVTGRKRIRLG